MAQSKRQEITNLLASLIFGVLMSPHWSLGKNMLNGTTIRIDFSLDPLRDSVSILLVHRAYQMRFGLSRRDLTMSCEQAIEVLRYSIQPFVDEVAYLAFEEHMDTGSINTIEPFLTQEQTKRGESQDIVDNAIGVVTLDDLIKEREQRGNDSPQAAGG